MSSNSFFKQPIGIQWRKALVSLPRVVPNQFIRYTSPEGPHPFVFDLPSRGKYAIPIYLFIPPNTDEDKLKALPIVLDFHGGGFVLGSCLEQAPLCAKLARDLSCIVVSVDYRMGPVWQHPAALEDAEDVLSAVLDESARGYDTLRNTIRLRIRAGQQVSQKITIDLDKTRVAISGFSSGGNIALNLGISVEGWTSLFPPSYSSLIPICLYFPALDCRQLPKERTKPPGMPMSSSLWGDVEGELMPTYLPRVRASEPRASPGLADIRNGLHKQAKIQLVLPELDSMAEQSEAWIQKVSEEGRGHDLTIEKYKGMTHGWTQMPVSWLKEEEKSTRADALEKTVTFIRQAWGQNH